MSDILITKALVNDVTTIRSIGIDTFYETFAASNTEADMQTYLNESFSEDKVSGELSNPESAFYIAWDGDEAIGYLKLNWGNAQTEIKDDAGIEIERIYVKQRYHGHKVGQLLYNKALQVAAEQERVYIWLGVWEENAKAIRFYTKNGFTPFSKHVFKMGADEQTDIMMKRLL